jgi:2-polyprenyl-6-methoxyphenol hydroxylase-like FAD-dependent oxidoreductase
MTIAIAGAGIGGLTAALSLHAAGLSDLFVLEAAPELRDLGVGINLPPHAVRELTELGLGPALAEVGVPTAALAYHDRAGRPIWTEPRGLEAGYRWPQYSLHRGRLQRLLADAVRDRLGAGVLRTGQRVLNVATDAPDHVRVSVLDTASGRAGEWVVDVLIGADGIRSAVRAGVVGAATPIATNGWVMYRGTSEAAAFLDDRTMVIVGDELQRVVVYPIAPGLINWLLVRPQSGNASDELGRWNVEADPRAVAAFAAGWQFDWLDVPALVSAAPVVYQYPMADIDPLPRWVRGNCALLGDAAHAMYPFGSNGASQAILDARVLAHQLATQARTADALQAYDVLRRPAASEVQLANRQQAGDVMARISEMARRNAHGAAAAELQAAESRYKRMAGFDVDTLNARASWSVAVKAAP